MDPTPHTHPRDLDEPGKQPEPQSAAAPALGMLAESLAKELSTHLSAVVANAQGLLAFWPSSNLNPKTNNTKKNGGTLDSTALQDVRAILREASLGSRVVADFLDLARTKDDSPQPVSLAKVVDQIVRVTGYHLRSKGVKLSAPDLSHIAAHQDHTVVYGDRNAIERTFLELILDSGTRAAASRGGGDRAEVAVEFLPGDGETIRIAIKCNGPANRDSRASWLDQTIGLLGGTIDRSSTTQGISQAVVSLPLIVAEIQDVAAGSQRTQVTGVRLTTRTTDEVDLPPTRILLVDDEEGVRKSISKFLSRSGFDVETAVDGYNAMEKLRSSQFNVVISDLRMPGMSGESLHAAIGRDYPDLANRMIFSSGDMTSEQTLEFLDSSGCVGLEKPYELHELLKEIDRIQTLTPPTASP